MESVPASPKSTAFFVSATFPHGAGRAPTTKLRVVGAAVVCDALGIGFGARDCITANRALARISLERRGFCPNET
jgi:hypothetical protein